MIEEMRQTDIILSDLTRFQERRIQCAHALKLAIDKLETTINNMEEKSRLAKLAAEAEMIRQGVTLPAMSKAMDWERDTNDGEAQWYDETLVPSWSPHAHLQCTMLTPKEITKLRDELNDLRARLNYHAVLHGIIQADKMDFATNVQMEDDELNRFLHCTEEDQEMRLTRPVLDKAADLLEDYLWSSIHVPNFLKKLCPHCKRKMHHESRCWVLHPERAPRCSNCQKTGHHSRQCKVCIICQKYGHIEDDCLYCLYCKRHGHFEKDCCEKNPILWAPFLAKKSRK